MGPGSGGLRTGSSRSGPSVLGVFGGAFDPPHLGHAMVPAYLRLRGLVDRVLVVPCADHPLGKDLSPLPRRMALARAAMAIHGDAVEVSDIEARLLAAHGGPSYTLRMLEAVAGEHPGCTVRLVVGSDILGEVQRWHRWEEIERRFSPIVVPRTGHAPADACALPAVSSTQVRAWLGIVGGKVGERVGAEAGSGEERSEEAWAGGEERSEEVWAGGEERSEEARAAAEEGLAAAVPEAVLRILRAPEDAPAVWVVGSGNVTAHAVPWLEDRGRRVTRLRARAIVAGIERWPDEVPAGVWLLARDPGLPELAHALARAGLPATVPVLHGAGALRAEDVLEPLRRRGHPVGTLHPICSVRAERPWPSPLPSAAFGVEGDPPARALALAWLEGQPWLELQGLSGDARRAYHAACSLAANHLAVPYAAAIEVLVGQGQPEDTVRAAIGSLMRSALDNLVRLGLPDGVTGPVARGDEAAVQAHLRALPGEASALYRVLSERLATMLARARAAG